jgi:hypothetical protein
VKRGAWRTVAVFSALGCLLTYGRAALAQSAQPPPPPGAPVTPIGPPPPGYPPQYPPPPYYAPGQAPYGAYQRPLGPPRMKYEEGDQVPAGYHVEQVTRPGPTIAGTIVLAVPYGIGLAISSAVNFKGQSGWLAVPVAGPWLMIFNRPHVTCNQSTDPGCVDSGLDTILRFYLAVDGVVQAVGGGLLVFGLNGRKILVRDDRTYSYVSVTPAPVGSSGYGALFTGRF